MSVIMELGKEPGTELCISDEEAIQYLQKLIAEDEAAGRDSRANRLNLYQLKMQIAHAKEIKLLKAQISDLQRRWQKAEGDKIEILQTGYSRR